MHTIVPPFATTDLALPSSWGQIVLAKLCGWMGAGQVQPQVRTWQVKNEVPKLNLWFFFLFFGGGEG